MTISAKVIADSVSPHGIRLTTMQITLHRYVLAEFNTHRAFSRNFRSSRAVPVAKLIKEVRDSPAVPIVWLNNKSGMQGGEPLEDPWLGKCKTAWTDAAMMAANAAENLMLEGLHKSWANRVIEPYLYVHGVVTATEWSNFFALRRHPDAQPEMRALADAMWEAREASVPYQFQQGGWHLPYVDLENEGQFNEIYDMAYARCVEKDADMVREMVDLDLIKISVARCARVSYLTHEGKPPNVEDDLKLYDRLVGSTPLHASPAEHQATPDQWDELGWQNDHEHGNLHGWRQHRKMLPNECARDR